MEYLIPLLQTNTMHLFDLCEHVKKRPSFYLNGKSIKDLGLFLAAYQAGSGFEVGSDLSKSKLVGAEDMRKFNDWVAKQLSFNESTSGWCHMILSKSGSDEKAFDMFFELLDKYRNGQSNLVAV